MAATILPLDYPLTVYTATTFVKVFKWKPDGTTGQDFTGWSASMWLSNTRRPPALTLSSTNAAGITLTSSGQILLTIQPSQTGALKRGVYQYNLDLLSPGGTVIRFLRGRCDVVTDAGPAT